MTATDILTAVHQLPLAEQQNLLTQLNRQLARTKPVSEEDRIEAEVDRLLIESGLMKAVPPAWDDDEDFEPIEITGPPLSETIIEERR